MKYKYLARIADNVLNEALEASGAALIEGQKCCGKTRTAEERAAGALYLQDPDNAASYLKAAGTKPSLSRKGELSDQV
jgi:hypothetical protein